MKHIKLFFVILAFLCAGMSALRAQTTITLTDEEIYSSDILSPDNAVTIHIASGTATISGRITCQFLDKTGNGTIILIDNGNAVAYSVDVQAGTLQIGNGTDGALTAYTMNLSSVASTLQIQPGAQLTTIPYPINGPGNLTYSGRSNQRLILTGVNNYRGSTTVYEGTLQIGNGISGSIANTSGVELVDSNSTLRFELGAHWGAQMTFDKVISGAGNVVCNGNYSLFLTGDNTYAGTTYILGCDLFLGNNTPSGSVKGDIINYGRFIFYRSDDYTYNGVISGSGGVNKSGGGKLLIANGNHTCTGGLALLDGTLEFSKWEGFFSIPYPDPRSYSGFSTWDINGEVTIGGLTGSPYRTVINFNLSGDTPSRITVNGSFTINTNITLNTSALGTASSYPLITAERGITATPFIVTGASGTLSATPTQLTFTPTSASDNNTNVISDTAPKAYPNPFTDALRITGAEGCTLRMINATGLTVHTCIITSPDETVQLSQLPAGVYFLQLEKDGTVKMMKVVRK